jgi:class 3 adenylate cyclase
MADCPACGAAVADTAKFCAECGTALHAAAPTAQVRKTVTVVFCDVVGSTALGERLDPEAQRAVMTRYFAEMQQVLESHGGRVEKFIGDAVMAVFGVPVANEDDALRAVRAAAEMQARLSDLAAQFRTDYGVEVAARIGVNTGEVVVGDGARGTIATGDPVNTAARLEQAAGPGDVLVGDSTYRLLPDAVVVEAVPPIAAKGKEAPVMAWRLVSVPSGTTRLEAMTDVAFVGRGRELRLLTDAFDRAVEERICQLVTLLGSPGTGKSRLTEAFIDALSNDALVLRGRCLSYGEGIAFWPLVEILRAATDLHGAEDDATARSRFEALLPDTSGRAAIVDRVLPLVAGAGVIAAAEEAQDAVRDVIEALATERPTVLIVDDVHWAATPMLDLVEHLVDLIRDVPVLVVCVGRPEFLEQRPGWGSTALNATTLNLGALSESDVSRLVGELLEGAPVDPDVVSMVSAAAGGNPLFVGQLVAMLRETGRLEERDGLWVLTGDIDRIELPPSISALLASRLDRLPPAERAVLEAASVMGMVFYVGALEDLLDGSAEAPLDALLRSLVRRDLVRSTASDIEGEAGFRFLHVLVREAAYGGLPKADRARLHERFADWLEARDLPGGTQLDDFIGFHLEQSFQLRAQLGIADAAVRAVGDRAARYLAAAAARIQLIDSQGAANRFLRIVDVASDLRMKALYTLRAARCLFTASKLTDSLAQVIVGLRLAEELGDEELVLMAQFERFYIGAQVEDPIELDEIERLIAYAEGRFDGNEHGELFVTLEAARAFVMNDLAQWAKLTEASRRGADYARRAGLVADEEWFRGHLTAALVYGPISVDAGLELWEEITRDAERPIADLPVARASRAFLLGLLGRLDEAREEIRLALDGVAAHQSSLSSHIVRTFTAELEIALGNRDAARRLYKENVEALVALGERAWLSTYAAEYAAMFVDEIGDEEARYWLDVCVEAATPTDTATQSAIYCLRAVLAARAGDHDEAQRHMVAAVDWVYRCDQLIWQGRVQERAGLLRLAAGDAEGARAHFEESLQAFDAKGDRPEVRRVRARLDELASVSGGAVG